MSECLVLGAIESSGAVVLSRIVSLQMALRSGKADPLNDDFARNH